MKVVRLILLRILRGVMWVRVVIGFSASRRVHAGLLEFLAFQIESTDLLQHPVNIILQPLKLRVHNHGRLNPFNLLIGQHR